MRRRVQQILCGALIAGTVLASQPLPVFAETDTETVVDTSEDEVKADADYEIKVNEDNPDTAILVSCHSDATELKIPEYIDGKKITEIGDWAFKDCKQITSLELPDSIEVLGFDLFDNVYLGGHTSLEKLKLPTQEIKTVRTHPQDLQSRLSSDPVFSMAYRFRDYAMYGSDTQATKMGPFFGCTELRKVEIPTGWTKVASHLFTGCTGLEYVGISDTVTELGRYAFKNCNIAVVDIPDNVETIGVECFADCPLVGIFGGKNLKEIHEWDYDKEDFDDLREYYHYVERYTFGDGTGTFYGYKGSYLEKWSTESEYSFVDLEEYEKDLDDYEIKTNEEEPWAASIVKYNGNENDLKVPAYINGKVITEIGDWAFKDCKNVTSLELPGSVEVLGFDLFDGYISGSNSNSLTSIKLPSRDIRVRSLPKYPITRDDLTPNYNYNIPGWGFNESGPFCHCAKLKNVEIPKGWTKVPAYLFADCSGLENVVIPKSVKNIEAESFTGCPLKSVSGYKGSYSENWAAENGFKFVPFKADDVAKIYGRNLSLDGKIGANVYVQLSDEILEDEDAYATISIGDREKKVWFDDVPSTEINEKTTLIFNADAKASETNEKICICLYSSDGRQYPIIDENGKKVEDSYTFTVADTARVYMNSKAFPKKLKKLAEAILNYGIYTQKLQNYKADELTATDDLTNIKKSSLKNYEVKKNGKVSGVSYAGFNLELKEDTGLAVYFKTTTDPAKLAITVDGKKMDVETEDQDGGKLVTVKINGISAQKLSGEREVIVSDGESEMSVKLSALSWSRNVLYGKNYSKETVDLAKMLYRYSSAADQYFTK